MIGTWLSLQVGVALVVLGAHLVLRLAPLDASRLQRVLLLVLPLALLGAPSGPAERTFSPAAQVWSPADAPAMLAVHLPASTTARIPTRPISAVLMGLSAIPALSALVGLRRLLRGAHRLRRLHGVDLWIAPNAAAPFAVWLGRPVVVLDPDTAFDPALASIAVRHELQHHRRHDPLYAWLLWGIALASPLALLLRRPFAEAEELAVDHALLQRGEPALPYAHALYALSTRASTSRQGSSLAPGMAAFLPRRITMLLHPAPRRPLPAFALVVLVLALAAPLGWAADGLVGTPTLTPAELTGALAQLDNDGFLHADHPAVQRALNQLTLTSNGSSWALAALDRSAAQRPWIEAQLAASGLPVELSAVPFVESGYRNRAESELPASVPPSSRGAGYWMFIAPTARAWGLTVNATLDERLDLQKETAAAIGLLSSDHVRYGDWGLALAAYNQGERAVDRAISAGGSRDAFVLAEAGLLNDYVAQVYAAAILMN